MSKETALSLTSKKSKVALRKIAKAAGKGFASLLLFNKKRKRETVDAIEAFYKEIEKNNLFTLDPKTGEVQTNPELKECLKKMDIISALFGHFILFQSKGVFKKVIKKYNTEINFVPNENKNMITPLDLPKEGKGTALAPYNLTEGPATNGGTIACSIVSGSPELTVIKGNKLTEFGIPICIYFPNLGDLVKTTDSIPFEYVHYKDQDLKQELSIGIRFSIKFENGAEKEIIISENINLAIVQVKEVIGNKIIGSKAYFALRYAKNEEFFEAIY